MVVLSSAMEDIAKGMPLKPHVALVVVSLLNRWRSKGQALRLFEGTKPRGRPAAVSPFTPGIIGLLVHRFTLEGNGPYAAKDAFSRIAECEGITDGDAIEQRAATLKRAYERRRAKASKSRVQPPSGPLAQFHADATTKVR